MILQFTFDATVVSDPINWKDVRIFYKRDSVVKSLLVTYTSQIEFSGDGYAYLNALGICDVVEVLIEYKCGPYDSFATLFSGVIIKKDIVFDHGKCRAKVVMEQNSGNYLFFKHKSEPVNMCNLDWGVYYNLAQIGPFTVNGDLGLNTINPDCYRLGTDNGTADLVESITGTSLSTVAGTGVESFGLLIDYVLQKMVYALSDGVLNFRSDFFTTQYQPTIFTIEFNGTMPTAGEIVEWVFIDEFGDTTTIQLEYNNFAQFTTALQNGVFFLTDRINRPVLLRSDPAKVQNYSQAPPVYCIFELVFYTDVDLVSFDPQSAVATTVKTQEWQMGGQDLYFLNGKMLDKEQLDSGIILESLEYGFLSADILKISFDELFSYLNKFLNLSFTIEFDAGQWYLRMEPTEYFYTATPLLTINDVSGIVKSVDKSKIGGSVFTGTQPLDIYYDYSNPAIAENLEIDGTWIVKPTIECEGVISLSSNKDKWCDFGERIAIHATQQDDRSDDLFLILGNGVHVAGSHFEAIAFYYNLKPDVSAVTVISDFYCYNVPLGREEVLLYHGISLPSYTRTNHDILKQMIDTGGGLPYPQTFTDTQTPQVVRDGAAYTPIIFEFERYISLSDFLLIASSQQIAINETSDPVNDVNCVINEIEFRVYDGFTRFKLAGNP